VQSKRLVIWKNGWLLRLLPVWNEISRSRLRARKPSLRSHVISDVDRPQKRLIVIHDDECASRVAITRGLFVQS
jgi:hypothetical protein